MDRGSNYDFSRDLFPAMLRDGKAFGGYVIQDYWTDIGNLEQYQQANYDALEGKVRVTIPGTETRAGHLARRGLPHRSGRAPARVRSCSAKASVVEHGRDDRAGERARQRRDRRANARASSARAVGRRYFGEVAALSRLHDRRPQHRQGSRLDRRRHRHRTRLHDRQRRGRERPNLKLWPDKCVTSGSVVSMSLIYGIKWPGSLFGSVGISGLANLEITPEFTLKLGQAFGSYLKHGLSVMTSRDTHPAARIMNRCVISGLLTVGIDVHDLRSFPLPLARYATRMGGDGGVHVRVAPNDPNSLLVELLDGSGINVDKATERKIENLFFREDFRRTAMDEVGHLVFPARSLEIYTSEFLNALKPRALPKANFKVVIDYGYGNASIVLPQHALESRRRHQSRSTPITTKRRRARSASIANVTSSSSAT